MTSVVHQDSQNAPLPDGPSVAFSVVNTCDAVTENDKFVEVRSIADPKNTSSEGQVIEWNVSGPAAGEYYSLKDSHFYFRYKFLQSADASATNPVVLNASYADPHDQVAPVQGFTSLLFSRFEMDINSTPVASQMSEYALCNYMHQLTTRTGRDLKAREFEEGWQRDSRNPSNPFAINTYSITKANTTATVGHANTITVASTAHGLVSNDVIVLNVASSMAGSPPKDANAAWAKLLNGKQFVATRTDADTFTFPLLTDTSGAGYPNIAIGSLQFTKTETNYPEQIAQSAKEMQMPASQLPFSRNQGHINRKMRYLCGGILASGAVTPSAAIPTVQSVFLQPMVGAWAAAEMIPTGFDIRCRFTVNKLRQLLVAQTDTALQKVGGIQFQDAILMLRRVKMSPSQDAAFLSNFATQPVRINQQYVKSQRTRVECQSSSTIRLRNILPGPMQDKYIVLCLRDDIASGLYDSGNATQGLSVAQTTSNALYQVPVAVSQMTFNDFAADDTQGSTIEFARLTVNSKDYPYRGDTRQSADSSSVTSYGPTAGTPATLAKTGGRDVGLAYKMYVECCPDPTDPPLTMEQFAEDIQPLCFSTSLTDNPQLADVIAENVDVSLEIRLSKTTSAAYSIIVMGYQRSVLELQQDGSVISDV